MTTLPVYTWRLAPDGLATRRQLRAAGLRPGGQDVAAQVERPRYRRGPLVAFLYRIELARPVRPMTPAKAAALFMIALSLGGLAVLMQFNRFTILLGIGSLAIVAVYPFMKRITNMPQFVLGLAFSWGGLLGWSAVFGRLDPPAYLIYAAAIAWTVGYDTIYAMQDIEDDVIAGIKSSARYFGDHGREAMALCFGLAVLLTGIAIWLVGGGAFAWFGLAAFAAHLGRQVTRLAGASSLEALVLFRSNRNAGLLLAAGLALDTISRALLAS